jgi:hypothetical protein
LVVSADSGDSGRFGHQCPIGLGAAGDRTLEVVATHPRTIELQPDAYDLVVREAERRGVDPDALVDELVRTDLGHRANGDLDAALDALAEFRAGLPPIDAAAIVREGRDELEARGA